MATLLVSFFNQLLTPRYCLGALDIASGTFRWVDLQIPEGVAGGAGLAQRADRIYFAAQVGGGSKLFVFDKPSLEVVATHSLKFVRAVHSLYASPDGRLLCVSTGSDEVYEIVLRGDEVEDERLFWRMPATELASGDQCHVNSVALTAAGYAVTFMKGAGSPAIPYPEGGIFLANTGELLHSGLRAPHSLVVEDSKMYVCHNPGKVSEIGHTMAEVGGFTRGLAISNGSLFVGVSGHRWRSTSTSKLYIADEDTFVKQGAKVVELQSQDLSKRREWDLRGLGIEVYDVMPVEIDWDSPYLVTEDPLVARACSLEYVAAIHHHTVNVEWRIVGGQS